MGHPAQLSSLLTKNLQTLQLLNHVNGLSPNNPDTNQPRQRPHTMSLQCFKGLLVQHLQCPINVSSFPSFLEMSPVEV